MIKSESDCSAELLTAAQMRAVEQAAIAQGATTGLDLMERAGAAVVAAALAERPALSEGAHAALVLCGPGNNGGDGFCHRPASGGPRLVGGAASAGRSRAPAARRAAPITKAGQGSDRCSPWQRSRPRQTAHRPR